MPASNGEPSIRMMFGEMEALVPIHSLAAEFELDGTPDGALLEKVVAGLRFVKVIHPGDSIPREILDGTASWSVEERHHAIARGRLTLQISTWLSGDEQVISDHDALVQLVEDPSIKAKVNTAIGEIAARLGIPSDRKQEVMDRVDQVVRELAYIEVPLMSSTRSSSRSTPRAVKSSHSCATWSVRSVSSVRLETICTRR